MRILVDINDPQVKALDAYAHQENKSRSALIRQAVQDFLAKRRASETVDAFGLWGDRTVDGLDYQERIRSEW